MPPPTAADAWLTGRHFGIVIDAGSSGSRLQIYSWKDPKSITLDKTSPLAFTLPKVEKGTQDGKDWVSKVQPGLSSFADNPAGVASYLRPLLSHARNHIPPSQEADTPLFLLATAGMRLLPQAKQAEVLKETCRFLLLHSHFKIEKSSDIGPCGSSVRIITGEEEGLFGWIAVNYLMDGFTGSSENRTTYGFLDMGGASTQIAFEPSAEHRGDVNNLIDVRLRLLGGTEISHKVFVTTWLGYGTNQARERYVGKAIQEHEANRSATQSDVVKDPCLPKGLELAELPTFPTPASSHAQKQHTLVGTGSFEDCLAKTSPLLNKTAPCPDTPCLMNGVYVPPIDFSVSHFIGISEYWFSSEHIFNLGGPYDYVQYERAASSFCSRDWTGIMKQHEESRERHQQLGDGEVEKDGKIVGVGDWGPEVGRSRLEMQCFKAAWVANVLHEGIGMPRITDPGGNVTTSGDKVVEKADAKGLGRPTFQSVESVGDIAISWTLGKMVLEASKEVPPLNKTARPLVDPIDDIPDTAHSPIKPIRPFYDLSAIEDRITPHLPHSLTRSSLGFSPVPFLMLVFFSFLLLLILFPLRRTLRAACLRSIRSVSKRADNYNLEEGKFLNGDSINSRPPSPTSSSNRWLHPIKRILSLTKQPSRSTPLTIATKGLLATPARASPVRAYVFPSIHAASGSSSQYSHGGSRSPSPAPSGFLDDGHAVFTSRSRNASQVNLAARQNAISRANSIHQLQHD